jgi:hypothetical protein
MDNGHADRGYPGPYIICHTYYVARTLRNQPGRPATISSDSPGNAANPESDRNSHQYGVTTCPYGYSDRHTVATYPYSRTFAG